MSKREQELDDFVAMKPFEAALSESLTQPLAVPGVILLYTEFAQYEHILYYAKPSGTEPVMPHYHLWTIGCQMNQAGNPAVSTGCLSLPDTNPCPILKRPISLSSTPA